MSDDKPIRGKRDGQPFKGGRQGRPIIPTPTNQANGPKIVPPQGGSGTAPPMPNPPKK